jgi:hypothetical protein
MTPRQILAVHDYRDLMHCLGVAESPAAFACPKCSARSFSVLQGYPMEVECLKCGTVAPFSVAVGYAEIPGEPPVWSLKRGPRAATDGLPSTPSYLRHIGTQWRR